MKKILIAFMILLASIVPARAEILIGSGVSYDDFMYFFISLRNEFCDIDTSPNNWVITSSYGITTVSTGSLTCDQCILSGCEFAPAPWVGDDISTPAPTVHPVQYQHENYAITHQGGELNPIGLRQFLYDFTSTTQSNFGRMRGDITAHIWRESAEIINNNNANTAALMGQSYARIDEIITNRLANVDSNADVLDMLEHMYPAWSRTGDGLAADVHEQLLSEFDNLLFDLTQEIQANAGGGSSGPVTLNNVGYNSDGQRLARIDNNTTWLSSDIYSAANNVSQNVEWSRQNLLWNMENLHGDLLDAIESGGGGDNEGIETRLDALIESVDGLGTEPVETAGDLPDSDFLGLPDQSATQAKIYDLLGVTGDESYDDLSREIDLENYEADYTFRLPAAACPTPKQLNVAGANFQLPYEPLCDIFDFLGNLVMLSAMFFVPYIVFGVKK